MERSLGLRDGGDGNRAGAQTERRGGAGPVRGLLGRKVLTGHLGSSEALDATSVLAFCLSKPGTIAVGRVGVFSRTKKAGGKRTRLPKQAAGARLTPLSQSVLGSHRTASFF